MPLTAGQRVGPYEVVGVLGSGGMGDVYRALDPRLGREVALKVLPEAVASDPERRLRFEREARAASALSHPGIVTVHDVGEHDGTLWIAMECVEGRTLREALGDGPLSLARAVDLATQVAEALARAHEAGIVHRDLKPENVMVSRQGFVKLLDFGLARPGTPLAAETDSSPTMPRLDTGSGVVLGTVGYMSPEQAQGRAADFRADQFSLGLVLYEMLTGRRAFARPSAAETLAAIIREEPEPLERLRPAVPVPLRWVVERCLAKDPEERWDSTRDLARDLRTVRLHLQQADTTPVAPEAGVRQRRRRVAGGLALLVALAATAAGGALAVLLARPSPTFHRLTFRRGTLGEARFSPDGQNVFYTADWEGEGTELFQTRTDSPEWRALGLRSAELLAISRSGEMALCLDRRVLTGFEGLGTLARAPLAGGAPRAVLEEVYDADWSPDGTTFALVREQGGRRRLEFPPGHALHESNGGLSAPRVSADGRWVAFVEHPVRGDNGGSIMLVPADGRGPARALGAAWSAVSGLCWRTRRELWFAAAARGNYLELRAVDLAGRRRRLLSLPGRVGLLDVARDGRVLLNRQTWSREMRALAPGAREERGLSWLDWGNPSDLSDDGRTLVFSEQGEGAGGNYAIYLRPTDASPAVRLGQGRPGALSPDGAHVLSTVDTSGAGPILLLPTAAGPQSSLPGPDLSHLWASWLPDGSGVVFAGAAPGRALRVWVQGLSEAAPRPVTPERFSLNSGRPVSPDGRRLVAQGGDRRLHVFAIPARGAPPAPPAPIPMDPSDELVVRWTRDGEGLLVYRPGVLPAPVTRLDVTTGRRTPWRELAPPDRAGVPGVGPVLFSADGTSYAYSYRRLLGDLYLVDGLR